MTETASKPAKAAPRLEGEALGAVMYRGGHVQIVAPAGSGKTEVVSQRITELLCEGAAPESIVAFTFTERAARSLKTRIERRISERIGPAYLDRLNGMFVGTIHGYCFSMLQQHVPAYANYDVLDEHRLTAFLTREAWRLQLKQLDGTLFRSIRAFGENLNVIDSEGLRPEHLDDPLRSVYTRYLALLEEHRFLTYGQMITRMVDELARADVLEAVAGRLRHLVVDEYQDVNPAQETLIRTLAGRSVHLCVIADDDQSIYQWRGSDVSNVLEFTQRYPDVKRFTIETNRRSRPAIVAAANSFSQSISGRLPKVMSPHRGPAGTPEMAVWCADREIDEAEAIARAIGLAHSQGYLYRDIAILCRGRAAFPELLSALSAHGIPVQPGGRTALFLQPDADLFGRTMCWLVDVEWRVGSYGWETVEVQREELLSDYTRLFGLSPVQSRRLGQYLDSWKAKVPGAELPANLVREFYELLRLCGVPDWRGDTDDQVNRLGTLARCSRVLVDYESTRRRARAGQDTEEGWRVKDRGLDYYKWLAIYIQNWAKGAYEGFEGEEDVDLDAVDLTTVHQAKGLEWPIVFVPSVTAKRFPSSRTGQPRSWHVPREHFTPTRYEGSDDDERRLLYVAITRARDFVSVSAHARINNKVGPSPYLLELASGRTPAGPEVLGTFPFPERTEPQDAILELSFSDLATYRRCALAYRLRRLLGFEAPIAPEIGYGKAVHHVLRQVAERVKRSGQLPTEDELTALFDAEFFMPAATREAYRYMRAAGERLVRNYIDRHEDDLRRVWETERPFELHLGTATISGRADVILDERRPGELRLAIVDYKTKTETSGEDSFIPHEFQLQVYTDAGRREGLAVDRAIVQDLSRGEPFEVAVDGESVAAAEAEVRGLVASLRARKFGASPGPHCTPCDVRELCAHRPAGAESGMSKRAGGSRRSRRKPAVPAR